MFYTKDKNRYTNILENGEYINRHFFKEFGGNNLTFKINVIPSRLCSTAFTYIYQFELFFKDQDFHVNIKDYLYKLPEKLQQLHDDVLYSYNQFIPEEEYKRKPNELDFGKVLDLCKRYGIEQIQENAPVISADKGKFNLANEEAYDLVTDVLYLRARGRNYMLSNGTVRSYNKEAFALYCRGLSDAQAAYEWSFGKKRGTGSYAKSIATAKLYGFGSTFLSIGAFSISHLNDITTMAFGKDVPQTLSWISSHIPFKPFKHAASFFDRFATPSMHNSREEMTKKQKVDSFMSRFGIPGVDLGLASLPWLGFAFSGPVGFALSAAGLGVGAAGAACQLTHYLCGKLNEDRGNLDIPKAMADVPAIDVFYTHHRFLKFWVKEEKVTWDGDPVDFSREVDAPVYSTGPTDTEGHVFRSFWSNTSPEARNNAKKNNIKPV